MIPRGFFRSGRRQKRSQSQRERDVRVEAQVGGIQCEKDLNPQGCFENGREPWARDGSRL